MFNLHLISAPCRRYLRYIWYLSRIVGASSESDIYKIEPRVLCRSKLVAWRIVGPQPTSAEWMGVGVEMERGDLVEPAPCGEASTRGGQSRVWALPTGISLPTCCSSAGRSPGESRILELGGALENP